MRVRLQTVFSGGLATGLIGYGAVVLLGALLDILSGRPLFSTPALFGSVLFYGLQEPYVVEIAAGPVLAYNATHLLAFLAIGLTASWLVCLAERYPSAQYLLLVLLVVVTAHVYAGLLMFATPLLGVSAWWQLGLPSVAAAAVMGFYLWRTHPLLAKEIEETPMGDPVLPGEEPEPEMELHLPVSHRKETSRV